MNRLLFHGVSEGVVSHATAPRAFLALAILVGLSFGAAGADWPEWRGPGGQGHALTTGLPTHWGARSNVTWMTALPGRGWSSPVIAGDLVWVTTAFETASKPEDAERRLKGNTGDQPLTLLDSVEMRAVALDRRSGRPEGEVFLLKEREPQWVHTLNSYASPTPVYADGRLYAHFGTFGTVCVDTRTRSVVWTNTSLRIMHENGPGSSPVLYRNLLIVHLDGSDTQSVVALDQATGRVVWRTPRSGKMNDHPQLKKSYATPNLVRIDGRDVLLSEGADWLYAYEPASGSELWKMSFEHLGFSQSARAVVGHGLLFLSTGYMRPEMLAVKYQGEGAPQVVWRYAKGAPTMPSPLLVGKELYFVSDSGGMLTCLDALSGEERYRERLGGNHSASLLFADGKILVASREGSIAVVAPGPTFQLLARNELPGKIMASPAAVDGALFVRTDQAMYRIEDLTERN